jgi:hypothetical protein
MTCDFEHDAGSYVLGSLSPQERVAFERHLSVCDGCTRAVREFAGLPGLLARIPVEVVDPEQLPAPVPDTLLPGAVRRARRSQRRRTWVAGGLVAAAAAVAAVAVGISVAGSDDEPAPSASPVSPTTAAPLELRPVGSSSVSGWVSLTSVGWGTRVDLTCEYRNPAVGGYDHEDRVPTYTMDVRTTDGSTEQVASWKGLPGKKMHLAAATAAARDDIVEVVVRSADGTPVLELSNS